MFPQKNINQWVKDLKIQMAKEQSLTKIITAASAEDYFHALATYTIFLGMIQILSIGCSLVRVTIYTSLALVILLLSLTAASLWWHKRKPNHVRQIEMCSRSLTLSFPNILVLFAIITFLLLCVLSYLRPDTSYDGNVYHIPTIHLWARKGYIYWIDSAYQYSIFMNGYPKGVELVGLILVKALNTSHVINMCNLVFMPLGVLGIAYISRVLGASAKVALFAGSAFTLIPVNIFQATTTYVDSAYASSAIASIAAALHTQNGLELKGSFSWSDLPILGFAMGLTLGAKTTGVILVATIVLVLALLSLLTFLIPPAIKEKGLAIKPILFLFFALMIGVIVGGYWYVRNFILTGSPIYPAGLTLCHLIIFPGPPAYEATGLVLQIPQSMQFWPEILRVLYTWSQGLLEWPKSIHGYDSRLGGLGYLWLFGGLPATLFLCYRFMRHGHSAAHRRFLLVLLAIVGIGFLMTPMRWWARYTLSIYALGLPCFAVVLDRIFRERGWCLTRLWIWMCLVLLVLEASVCLAMIIYPSSKRDLFNNPYELLQSRNWRAKPVHSELTNTLFDEVLRGENTIAVGPLSLQEASITGLLSLPIGYRKWITISGDLGEGDIDKLILQKVRIIIWDKTKPIPLSLKRLAIRIDDVPGLYIITVFPNDRCPKY